MKIIACIQVRMDSSRLKGKALMNIAGKPSIQWLIDSVMKSRALDGFVIATTTDKTDDPLVDYLKDNGYNYYRGSVTNVAERLFNSGIQMEASHIVRIVGDHPFNSFEIIDYLIEKHLENNSDFTSINREQIAIGVLSEVISIKSFEKLINSNVSFDLSEYLTYYFTNNKDIFKVRIEEAPKEIRSKKYRFALDYPNDKDTIENLLIELLNQKKEINLINLLEIVRKNPEILDANSHHEQKYLEPILLENINRASKIQ
jgi:N,N'-diacetyllegionaminate synthase